MEKSRVRVSCDLCGADEPKHLFERHGDSYVKCLRCHLIYITPQPSNAELEEIYGAHYYDAWGMGEGTAQVAELKRRSFSRMLAFMSARTGVRTGALLDLGCASGFLLEVARACGFEPHGIELNSVSASQAAEKFGSDRIHCGTTDDNPFSKGAFRVVVMSDLLEHVRSPRRVLHQTYELLEPEGVLLVLAPNVGGLWRRLLGKRWTDFKREHLFYFDKVTLRMALERSSFRVLEICAFPKFLTLAYIHSQLSHYYTPVFSELVSFLRWLAPNGWARRPFPIFAGSMLAVAKKA